MKTVHHTNSTKTEEIAHLSKNLALMYLNNEFGSKAVKVTTYLNNSCWTGKVLIEATDDDYGEDDAEFYTDYILSSVKNREDLEKIIKKLQKVLDN